MPTKLSRYCEGILEAVWLAALIVVPVFFNVYSSRIFEPDKITLLRTLTLVALAAWLVKIIEEKGIRWERMKPGSSWRETLMGIPLFLPVAGVAIIYIIATLFSVTPSNSLWGSYQRLQGTYTTFSYLILFATLAVNLRRRAQVDRLITTVVLASLPVALYGVLQRYQLDPVPWGGDVSTRIAANMGNSIFVAAYLIMAFPLTAARVIDAFRSILADNTRGLANFTRATAYVFIAALQVIALLFSGSRGPLLGWLAGTFFMFVGLSLLWRRRWLTVSVVVSALLAGAFLIVFNIPNGPLESLRSVPGIGRLGHLLDSESKTVRVRALIWEGAADLVMPHEPLTLPDGNTDPFNFLRPLIGYGPESMYVAYNPFYPPDLTQVEKRNASPDRSHNETWDSLVITGFLGLVVYLSLFVLVFYYGMKWLGLVGSQKQRNLFLALTLGGAVVGGLVAILINGLPYLGVGLPFGIILGLFAYLFLTAIFSESRMPESEGEWMRSLVLVSLLSVVIAHFVEINFGIAIVSTRTYFWVFSALLVVVGYVLPHYGEYGKLAPSRVEPAHLMDEELAETTARTGNRRERSSAGAAQARKKSRKPPARTSSLASGRPTWVKQAVTSGLIVAVLLVTLGFDFISNAQGGRTALEILSISLTRLRGSSAASFGVLGMIVASWLIGSLLLVSEETETRERQNWGKSLLTALGVSFVVALVFWLFHASYLAFLATSGTNTLEGILEQVGRYEGILANYYVYLFLVIFGLAAYLPEEWPARAPVATSVGMIAAPVVLIAAFVLASYTNLRIIQADIAFKLADPFTRNNQWPVAIAVYGEANDLAPNEDYYYLFLGRAYLEHAKTISDAAERDTWIARAERDLLKAQSINPLNTDHTANLARLYSLWSSYAQDPETKRERGETSAEYFSKATTLSPNNARLWDEWALLRINVLEQPDEAYPLLERALELDPFYDWTYGLLGDYHARQAQQTSDTTEKNALFERAADYYHQALEMAATTTSVQKYSYAVALANVESQLGRMDGVISAYSQASQFAPSSEKWRVEETLARLYQEKQDYPSAMQHARQALEIAPENQRERIQVLISEINAQL